MLVEEQQHLDLAGGERRRDRVGDARAAAVAAPHLVEQPARDQARERSLAVRDPVEERRDPFRRLCLQEIARSTGANRLEKVLLGAGGGQDDDLALRRRLPEPRQCRETVEAGHREVEQDEVRLEPADLLDRLGPVGGAPDHLEAMGAEQRGESLPSQRVVVDDHDRGSHS